MLWPQVRAKADAWAYAQLRTKVWNNYLAKLRVPAKGDLVTVVKGRKVKVGTKGKLFWVGQPATFGPVPRFKGGWSPKVTTKVGVALDDTKNEKGQYANVVWTYLENLEADVKSKFKYSAARSVLSGLKHSGAGAWLAYQAHPALYYWR